jgi:hypothetical protein
MTFARVLGRQFVTNQVEAITRVNDTVTNDIFDIGAGLVAVRNDKSDDCFKVNGSADLVLHDTGIFVNCSGNSALFLNGSAHIGMDADAEVSGCTNDLSFPISGDGTIQCNAPQQPVSKSMFEDIPTTLPTPVCSTPGSQVGTTMSPGFFNTSVTISNGTVFNPGTYCFNSSLNLGNQSISFSGDGSVQWVLSSSVSLSGTANFGDTGDSLEIYANNANFTVKNTGFLPVDRFRFFGIGNSSFVIQGGTMNSNDAYIYSETGEIDIDAQADVNLHAPVAPDTFAGILMYLPWDNPNDFELNGGTNNIWTGLILMPHTDVTYNGGAGFELHGQVIGYTFKINGGGESDIYFESSGLGGSPNEPSIEFTK